MPVLMSDDVTTLLIAIIDIYVTPSPLSLYSSPGNHVMMQEISNYFL